MKTKIPDCIFPERDYLTVDNDGPVFAKGMLFFKVVNGQSIGIIALDWEGAMSLSVPLVKFLQENDPDRNTEMPQ